ncbi:DUF3780 domain-containing protein [Aurantimonas sp. A2-1-M11]|uniref:DUF3780 domain-containing protein n=1 Tax=Aurantimonas sp. A2-1-M11 TaxID=3113712 RepID=UPI003FA59288
MIEHFGLIAVSGGDDHILRCRLPRRAWNAIRDEAKRVLNERLREKKLTIGRWNAGDNAVERLLGRELCPLAWAVEKADSTLYPVACASWIALKREEKWWLFRMCDVATGEADAADVGWRKAVRVAFTEVPGPKVANKKKRPVGPSDGDLFPLPLFGDR